MNTEPQEQAGPGQRQQLAQPNYVHWGSIHAVNSTIFLFRDKGDIYV